MTDEQIKYMRARIACLFLLLSLASPAPASGPDDPRALDLWAMYSRDGNCKGAPRCIDGYPTRQKKRTWMPLYLADAGVPASATRVFVLGLLNVTHPAGDKTTCSVYVMFATDEGMADVDGRTDRQWVFRVQSSPETGSQRVTQGTPLKVTAGRVWMRYWFSGDGDYEAGRCSYGIRLSVADWD